MEVDGHLLLRNDWYGDSEDDGWGGPNVLDARNGPYGGKVTQNAWRRTVSGLLLNDGRLVEEEFQ